MQNADKLDSIYDELVKLRDTMGKKLGHENYIPLGYDRMGRTATARRTWSASAPPSSST